MPFQTTVNALTAPGIAGDFASANPRAVNLASQYYNSPGFRAGPNGLTMGLFAWLDPATYTFASNAGAGAPDAFVHRDMTGLITTYLTEFGFTIPAGFQVGNLFSGGDFFVVNNGSGLAVPKMKAYANNSTGVATFAAAGAPTTGGSGTASSIAAATGSFTGSIADGTMTITAVGSGAVVVGGILSGTGVASGTQVISQLTGTAGGVGTYAVSPREQTVASTTISETYGILTVGGTVTGAFAVGQTVLGTGGGGVTAGTVITSLGTGTGGAGTYNVQTTQTVTSSTITTTTNTETKWICKSFGQPGEVVIISNMT